MKVKKNKICVGDRVKVTYRNEYGVVIMTYGMDSCVKLDSGKVISVQKKNLEKVDT